MAKARQVEYNDPEGRKQTGWYLNGHVYTDEAATQPIAVGSTFLASSGRVYRQTKYGGVLWSAPRSVDASGAWVPQGDPWYRAAQDLLVRQENRPAFAYDPGSDPLYLSARDQSLRNGRRAMEDTLGKTANLTGGYASTYAQTAGQQAYGEVLAALEKRLPEFYDRARASYDAETKAILQQIDAALGLYDKNYRNYLEAAEAARWQQDFDRDNAQWAQELAWAREKWQKDFDRDNAHWQADFDRDNDHWQQDFDRDNAQWAQKFAADYARWQQEFDRAKEKWEAEQQSSADRAAASAQEQRQSYAYRMAMLALQQGLAVSDALLEEAGIDKTYAERLRRYFAARNAAD